VNILNKVLIAVRLARPRTWAFSVAGYLLGYMAAATPAPSQMILGIMIFALGTAATNLVNAYTDVEEDSINLPQRAEMVKQLGRRNLVHVLWSLYPLIVIASSTISPLFLLIVAVAEVDSIGYSLPPLRFKQHPVTALLSFSGAVVLPYVAGAVAAEASPFSPLLLLLGSFMFAYGTVKNIPDIIVDAKAGLKTTATISASLKRTVETSTILLLTPYLLLTTMIALDLLSRTYIIDLIFLPFLAYWSLGNAKATDAQTLEMLHRFGFVYAVSFILFNIVITYPSQASLVIGLSTLVYITAISRLSLDSRPQQSTIGRQMKPLRQKDETLGIYRR